MNSENTLYICTWLGKKNQKYSENNFMDSYLPGHYLETWKKNLSKVLHGFKIYYRYACSKPFIVWKGGAVTHHEWNAPCSLLSREWWCSWIGPLALSLLSPSDRASEREWWWRNIQAFSPLKAKGPDFLMVQWLRIALQCRGADRSNPCAPGRFHMPQGTSKPIWAATTEVYAQSPGSTTREATAIRPHTARQERQSLLATTRENPWIGT